MSELRGVFDVASLVHYQAETIVSRIVAKSETGSVTLFAFDRGQELSEHTAPFDALVHMVDGEAEITLSGKTHLLCKGQAMVLPANKPHAVRAFQRFKMMLTMLKK